MVFNENLMFIHIGKTGGMSCSEFLLRNLSGEVYNCHETASLECRKKGIEGVNCKEGVNRHCTLIEALDYLKTFKKKKVEDFEKVVAVIRHPFTLEFSFYNHLRKPMVQEQRRKRGEVELADLALGDFPTFVEGAGYHREGHPQEKFFLVDGVMPSNVDLVHFEDLESAFLRTVGQYLKTDADLAFPKRNTSSRNIDLEEVLSERVKDLICEKHSFMFENGFYTRY